MSFGVTTVKFSECFEGTFRLHLQGRRLGEASGPFLILVFDPEYRGPVFLRNVR
jgi:hypothetical protein